MVRSLQQELYRSDNEIKEETTTQPLLWKLLSVLSARQTRKQKIKTQTERENLIYFVFNFFEVLHPKLRSFSRSNSEVSCAVQNSPDPLKYTYVVFYET